MILPAPSLHARLTLRRFLLLGVRGELAAPDASPTPVRVILGTVDEAGTRTVRLLKSQAPADAQGDTLRLSDGRAYTVQGQPRSTGTLDDVWTVSVVPV